MNKNVRSGSDSLYVGYTRYILLSFLFNFSSLRSAIHVTWVLTHKFTFALQLFSDSAMKASLA